MAKKRYHSGAAIVQPNNNRCNLPQDVMIKDISPLPTGGFDDYNDDMTGIDRRISDDAKENNRKGKAGRW